MLYARNILASSYSIVALLKENKQYKIYSGIKFQIINKYEKSFFILYSLKENWGTERENASVHLFSQKLFTFVLIYLPENCFHKLWRYFWYFLLRNIFVILKWIVVNAWKKKVNFLENMSCIVLNNINDLVIIHNFRFTLHYIFLLNNYFETFCYFSLEYVIITMFLKIIFNN